ncbi:hypothetical protein R6Q57_018878 [Mikania cordata]
MIKDKTYNKGIEDPLSRVLGPEHGGRTRTVSNVIGQAWPSLERILHGRLINDKCVKVQVDTVIEGFEKTPFHDLTRTDEIICVGDTLRNFIQWPRDAIKVDTIDPQIQQQYQVGPMGFVNMIEQGDQIQLQETQIASTSVPKIPSPKFVDPEIDIALEKIKKRPQAIQSIYKMLADYVGDEHAIICNSSDGMYAETYEEGLSYVELLQLFCNDWLDVTIIHFFAM